MRDVKMHGSIEKNIEYLRELGYSVEQPLGRGAHSATFLVKKGGREYAAKTINPYACENFDADYNQLDVSLSGKIAHIRNEFQILQLAHEIKGLPRAFMLYEKNGPARSLLFNLFKGDGWCNTEQMALIREYVQGRRLGENERIDGAYNSTMLSLKVGFLHDMRIAGLDLRPSNVIIAPNGEPYLIDLGHAQRFGSETSDFKKNRDHDRRCLEKMLGR